MEKRYVGLLFWYVNKKQYNNVFYLTSIRGIVPWSLSFTVAQLLDGQFHYIAFAETHTDF